MFKNSCKDCKDRYLGCHSKCEKYKEFRNKINQYHVYKNQINECYHFMVDEKKKLNTYCKNL